MQQAEPAPEVERIGDVAVLHERRCLIRRSWPATGEEHVERFSRNEWRFLAAMLQARGHLVQSADLAALLLPGARDDSLRDATNHLRQYVLRSRRKLVPFGWRIENVHSAGYILVLP